jgi:hypothetical protein
VPGIRRTSPRVTVSIAPGRRYQIRNKSTLSIKAFLFQGTRSILTHDRWMAFLKEKMLTLGPAHPTTSP